MGPTLLPCERMDCGPKSTQKLAHKGKIVKEHTRRSRPLDSEILIPSVTDSLCQQNVYVQQFLGRSYIEKAKFLGSRYQVVLYNKTYLY